MIVLGQKEHVKGNGKKLYRCERKGGKLKTRSRELTFIWLAQPQMYRTSTYLN
ncbi:hypothetical protein BS78_09G148100 [Paspalum vaginatum]|nr:hypothetical protein BS78_09G148100 [Paspalum vaginatum]